MITAIIRVGLYLRTRSRHIVARLKMHRKYVLGKFPQCKGCLWNTVSIIQCISVDS